MAEVGPNMPVEQVAGRSTATTEDRVSRRPELDVVMIASGLAVLTFAGLLVIPDLHEPVRNGGWTAFVAVTVLFGVFEYTVFHVEFRRAAIAFSLSEIPTAIALVFLAPLPALAARLPLSVLVLFLARRPPLYKLVFNAALIAFEIVLAVLVFRVQLEWWGDSDAVVVLAVVTALVPVTPLTSMLVSLAISRLEGGAVWRRVAAELRATWWMYTVNPVLAAMIVALALIDPWLAALGALPTAGMWLVLRAHGALGQDHRDLEDIHGFAGRVGQTLRIDEIARTAVDEAARLLRAEAVVLVLIDDELHGARPTVSFGRVDGILPSGGATSVMQLVTAEARLIDRSELSGRAGPGKLILAPVGDETGRIAALVVSESLEQRHRFDATDVARVQNLAEQLAPSLRKGMLHERLEWEARHDALTELPTRTLFERRVNDVVEAHEPDRVSGIVMLDLDRFKEVNDTLGHHAGDDLLVRFSRRISATLSPGDVLARLAGDEFAVLCHRSSRRELVEFARGCLREGGRPVTIDGLELVVTVSVGVAEITADDHDAVQPMRRADIAMYNAKGQRTGVEIYRDEIDRRTPARLSMLGDLRAAIEDDDLDVVYQPKLELASGRIVGVEALVRWTHAGRGIVPATEFVRVAEDTGLIKDLTDLVMARGTAMLRQFREAGLPIGLAINLSTHDLFDSRLPVRVRDHLDVNGVDPSALTLEITESSLFIDAPRTRATIDGLRDVGIRMAVDDFGTGYSSLSYLRRLPVHELKIDRSFVEGMLTDPQDEVIVKSTIDLGHNLGLLVVAEGVESRDVLGRLSVFGCDVAQGFCISQPVDADGIVEWLQRAELARTVDTPTDWIGTFG